MCTAAPPRLEWLNTSTLPIGEYELQLIVGDDHVTLDELIWILREEDYANLLKEEMLETDPHPPSSLLEYNPDANQSTVRRLIQTAFHEKLTGFLRFGHTLAMVPAVQVSFEGMPRFSLNVITYLAEVFADVFATRHPYIEET